jgi:hypothetical protein
MHPGAGSFRKAFQRILKPVAKLGKSCLTPLSVFGLFSGFLNAFEGLSRLAKGLSRLAKGFYKPLKAF